MKKTREADFQIFKKESQKELQADIEGATRLERLVLIDQKTGKDWEVAIYDGKLHIFPFDLDERRDFMISKAIDED
jgi:hypothetical protein